MFRAAARGTGPAMDARRAAFQLHLDGLLHGWFGTAVMMTWVLVPSFIVLDWFAMPRDAVRVASPRTGRSSTALLVVQWFVIRRTRAVALVDPPRLRLHLRSSRR